MKISLNWLNEYIDIAKYRPEHLAEIFTGLGIEVETIANVSPFEGDVVIGKILEALPHPNADTLQVCKVDVGENEPLDIVCGATNARKGLTVAAARIGSVLPGDFKIKPSKIRGEKSFGMLCGETELGMGDNDSGIMELDSHLKPGSLVADVFKLRDTVMELSLTPNRADCLGYLGLARDLSAKLGLPLKTPEIYQNAHSSSYKTAEVVKVQIDDEESCGRFCALALKNVKVQPSPLWLRKRLEASGMRPVNLVVDATNYVMLEYGQPIHAYDRRDIGGNKIVVRFGRQGETITTLDGTSRSVGSEDILICDAEKPIGIAGIMGGENSEIKEDSSEVVIEVASFHPIKVRKTAKRLAIHSEASHRFERGTDIEACDVVAHRVAGLIASATHEVNPEQKIVVSEEIIDCYPNPAQLSLVALRLERLRQISGDMSYDAKKATDILEGLGFQQVDKKDDRLLFQVPSWRHDVHREIDLIEEIMRVNGFENIVLNLPVMDIRPLSENFYIRLNEQLRCAFASNNYLETMSFPFVSEEDLTRFKIPSQHPMRNTVKLRNPIVSDESFLQPSVIISLLKALDRNRRQGQNSVRLFECARAYFKPGYKTDKGYFGITSEKRRYLTERASNDVRPVEIPVVAGIIGQPRSEKSWSEAEKVADFFTAKNSVVSILNGIGIKNTGYTSEGLEELPFLHPGASALVTHNGTVLGFIGELHPEVSVNFGFDLKNPPVVVELLVERVLAAYEVGYAINTEQFKFPPTSRDLAFLVPEQTKFSDFDSAIEKFKKRNMSDYSLFDVYSGDNVKEGFKSMAFNFQFQSSKKTLNDKEVDKEIELLLSHLKNEVRAELR